MEFASYLLLVIMGITLGLVGAGGSILTIPILVYMQNMPIILATSYSLIVVGLSALVASIRHRQHIQFRKSIIFIIPSILGVFGTRYFILPKLPTALGSISIDNILLVLLLIFIGLAGYLMIKIPSYPSDPKINQEQRQPIRVIFLAFGVGITAGMLGAGGGFLIIPALIYFMEFSMKEATATSLLIITINSCIGFAGDKQHLIASDWIRLSKYLCCTLLGMCIGMYIEKFIKGEHLKKSFGYFIWAIGIAILAKEFIL